MHTFAVDVDSKCVFPYAPHTWVTLGLIMVAVEILMLQSVEGAVIRSCGARVGDDTGRYGLGVHDIDGIFPRSHWAAWMITCDTSNHR